MFNIENPPGIDWTITVSQARTTLAALIALLFTVLSLSMSMTSITLNNLASHYSLRMLAVEVDDYRTKIATSVFALAVSCIVVELFKLTRLGSDELAPRASFLTVILLIALSAVALFWQMNYTIRSLRLDRTLTKLRHVVGRTARRDDRRAGRWATGSRPELGSDAVPVLAESSGYVVEVDLDAIRKCVDGGGCRVAIDRLVGTYVTEGDAIGWIAPDEGRSPESAVSEVASSVSVADRRDIANDVSFGIRILVDVGSLALSPAINDPYTAVQVADTFATVFEGLADKTLGPRCVAADGVAVAWVNHLELADYLELATKQLSRYGANEPMVVASLVRICDLVERNAQADSDRARAKQRRKAIIAASEPPARSGTPPGD